MQTLTPRTSAPEHAAIMPKSTLRRPPPYPHAKAAPGFCRACGESVLTAKGKPHKGRRWCDKHQLDGKVIGDARRARAAVFMRDMGICAECGEDCTSYETLGHGDVPRCNGGAATYRVQINREKALEWCRKALTLSARQPIWAIDLGEWHVDHICPLHLVDRERPDAWSYWGMSNLCTLCPSCHEIKTTKEAKGRAKVRRITGQNKVKPKRKIQSRNDWPKGRKLQSRGFGK